MFKLDGDWHLALPDGDGSFTDQGVLSVSNPQDLRILGPQGDFDGDGKADLTFSHASGGEAVLFGDGAGGFTRQVIGTDAAIAIGDSTSVDGSGAGVVADLDGDGLDELIDLSTKFATAFGYDAAAGDLVLKSIVASPSKWAGTGAAAVEATASGGLALLTEFDGYGVARMALDARGLGGAEYRERGDTDGQGVDLVYDVDGDGTSDLVLTDNDGLHTSVVLGGPDVLTGRKSAPSYPDDDPPGSYTRVQHRVFMDLDNDGTVDHARAYNDPGNTDAVAVGLAGGDEHVESGLSTVRSLWVADLDGEGFADIVFGSGGDAQVRLLSADGLASSKAGSGNPAAVGDFDNDGDHDLVAEGSPGTLYLNQGGRFDPVPLPVDVETAAVAADFDEDGALDLYVPGPLQGVPSVLIGDGKGGFDAQSLALPGVYEDALRGGWPQAADVDGDGHIDVLVGSFRHESLAVLLGQGDGSFELRAYAPARVAAVASAGALVGDVDGDGRVDLAAARLVRDVSTSDFWASNIVFGQ